MSTAGSADSAASRGEAARARTERANELRRNRVHLDAADGGHRGADANTDYVGPQEGEVLAAAAPAAAV